MARIFHILILWFLCSCVYGQDSLDVELDMLIEDASISSGGSEGLDWSNITERLVELKRNPINLNKASMEDLRSIPYLTPVLIHNLFEHIRKYGALLSIYELQAVPGFTKEVFERIKPYVTVQGQRMDVSNEKHPRGPSFAQIRKDGKWEWIGRVSKELEQEAGYTATNGYLGNPYRYYTRMRYRYLRNVSISLIGEKDPGELFEWNTSKKQYGFDFVSGHFALRDFGRLKSLVIGDYNMQFGQGLVLSRGLGFGKSGEVIQTVKPMMRGILPYSSVNEAFYMRGVACQYAFGDWYLTGFVGRTPQDAYIREALDSSSVESGDGNTLFSEGLITSGLHRTERELAGRNTVTETGAGGRIHWEKRFVQIGFTGLYQQFSLPLMKSSASTYQKFDFQGDRNYVLGLEWDVVYRNLNSFGEVARSQSGGMGFTTGLLASLDPKVDFALNIRHFDKDFHSLKGYSFSERPYALQGESGMYLGLRFYPNTRWQVSMYIDHYRFTWYRYLVSYPSSGWDGIMQVNYRPNRGTLIYLRYRIDMGQENVSSSALKEGELRYPVAERRQGLRLDYSSKLHRTLSIHGRAEHSWYWKEGEPKALGFVLFQDIAWQIAYSLKITARTALFNTSNYDARIYAFENQVPTVYGIPAYQGKGIRNYIMLQFSPIKALDIWVRYAVFVYDRYKSISSGLSEIQGNKNSELTFQVRLKF